MANPNKTVAKAAAKRPFDPEMATLEQWLMPLNELPLECDGMTRVISALLSRDCIGHRVHIGSLTIPDVGTIPLHWWIVLDDGRICDFRATMWLGNSPQVPHGVFAPEPPHGYATHDEVDMEVSPVVFNVLAGRPLSDFPVYREKEHGYWLKQS